MMEEGASYVGWWSDVMALLASLVFAWPVVRTSFRLRRAEQTDAPPASKNAPRTDDRLWTSHHRDCPQSHQPIPWIDARPFIGGFR